MLINTTNNGIFDDAFDKSFREQEIYKEAHSLDDDEVRRSRETFRQRGRNSSRATEVFVKEDESGVKELDFN